MKNMTVATVMTIFVAILVLAVGFATINAITLTISGSATAGYDSANFSVKFTGTPTKSGDGTITATITDDKTATMTVTGLTTAGQTATAVYTITNASPEVVATLSSNLTQATNTDYFEATKSLSSTTIAAGGTATLTLTVTLKKTPVETQNSGTFSVTIDAEPTAAS